METVRRIPLKFGLILASYPDVLPISLSRKSEGDMGTCRVLAALSTSLQCPTLSRDTQHRRAVTVCSARIRALDPVTGHTPSSRTVHIQYTQYVQYTQYTQSIQCISYTA